MTKEELLEHHIMVPDTFDKDKLLLYCNAGYKLLYKMRHNNNFILVIIYKETPPFPNYKTKLKDRYRCIVDDSYNELYYDDRRDSLMLLDESKYYFVRNFLVCYDNII